ncbi:MAG: BrnT family toxin [Mariprofundaceae bacterium]|nr:BrnT family toxin [Mariprofundaceae bacterium]
MRYVLHGIKFEWDDTKYRTNVKKHDVSFKHACEAFFDPFLVVVDASEDEECRDSIIAYDGSSRLLFVVHILRDGDCFRIISARKATRQERIFYEIQ